MSGSHDDAEDKARKQRAHDIRTRIKSLTTGGAPAPSSPREFTDRAAEAEYERSKEDARPPGKPKPKPD